MDSHSDMQPNAHGSNKAKSAMSHQSSHHAHMAADFKKRFFVSLILTVPVLALSHMIQEFLGIRDRIAFTGDMYVLVFFASVVFFYGGLPFFKGLANELKTAQPGMMTLISLAVTTAYVYSSAVVLGLKGEVFFWETVTLIDIMLLGHWIEMKSVMGASRALNELAKMIPAQAHKVMPDGSILEVLPDDLTTGDLFLVKPGENIPADGKVVKGETSINESMLTGESVPVSKKEGGEVIGGSINGDGSITVEVTRKKEDSFLSQVIRLVEQAQESKSKTQDLANRAAKWLTLIAITGGAITLAAWTIILRSEFAFAIERTVTVMVITCPHALGLAVPLVVAVSTALSAKNGLLVRDRVAFERARNIQAMVFDKTGTLTEGRFGVSDIVVLASGIDDDELMKAAASIEVLSEHPIAQAIAMSVEQKYQVEGFKAIPGKGAGGVVNGKEVMVASPGYLTEAGLKADDPRVDELSGQGKTVVFVIIDGEVKGAIALVDVIRPESKEAIAALKGMGIQCMMLTGDNRHTAGWVAKQLGLDDYFAEVLPQEKSAKIIEVQQRGLIVGMTGDGVNDAPALAQADIGIAIGAGTDVAIEAADIILVKNNPQDVVAIIGLARATYRKMIQNLIWATGYNIVTIPVAAGVLYGYGIILSPAIGAVFMSLSTVIVAVNASLLKFE